MSLERGSLTNLEQMVNYQADGKGTGGDTADRIEQVLTTVLSNTILQVGAELVIDGKATVSELAQDLHDHGVAQTVAENQTIVKP